MGNESCTIAMVGAGPAALYSTAKLAEAGHNVVIINRDIKPGGLAEFGIFPTKLKMKKGLRTMFSRILDHERVSYLGNVRVGTEADVTLDELRQMGFDALVVAVGAQGTKWLGLDGEDAECVYHAKDLVYHYNHLPPFSERDFRIGQNVCVIGLGNVCLDIVHWLVCHKEVESVTAVARRGPDERKTTKKEMKLVSAAIDLEQLQAEFAAIGDELEAVGQNPQAIYEELTRYVDEPLECGQSDTKFRMRFMRSPARIEVDDDGEVTGLTCEKTRLVRSTDSNRIGLEKLGEYETIPCDTVIFAIGDSIEPAIGLPLEPKWKSTFATVPQPWSAHPDRPRYMVFDPTSEQPLWDTFVVGWARKASDGLVGKAKADGEQGCDEILAFLDGEFEVAPRCDTDAKTVVDRLADTLREREVRFVDYACVKEIDALEKKRAKEEGVKEFKFSSNEEMLQIALEE